MRACVVRSLIGHTPRALRSLLVHIPRSPRPLPAHIACAIRARPGMCVLTARSLPVCHVHAVRSHAVLCALRVRSQCARSVVCVTYTVRALPVRVVHVVRWLCARLFDAVAQVAQKHAVQLPPRALLTGPTVQFDGHAQHVFVIRCMQAKAHVLTHTEVERRQPDGGAEGRHRRTVVIGRRNGQVQIILNELTGRKTVPNAILDGRSIGGGDELARLQQQGTLRSLLEKAGCTFGR